MPLSPGAAAALREVTIPAVYQDEVDRRFARALAWLGRPVVIHLRFGTAVEGTVEGVAKLPHIRLQGVDSGVLLLRRGGPGVDVLEGYVLGTITDIVEVESRRTPVPARDRRERFD